MVKKVIYLLGAGATQAVIKDLDPDRSLMTSDIQRLISGNYSNIGIENRIWNELITEGNDVEHLISVLETQYNYKISNRLRNFYRRALIELASPFSKLEKANLYSVLVDLHSNVPQLKEELVCIMTLNYEDILERSIKKHLKYNVDYVIATDNITKPTSRNIKVLKLHGSFNWFNSRPIKVESMKSLNKNDNALWIPPGVEKRTENYPFNLLWGKAKELLMDCDILRIVGCSLSRNDWALIPILYIIQKFNDNKKTQIEIIDYLSIGNNIEKNYNYLNIKKITDIETIKEFYKRKFPDATEDAIDSEMKNHFNDKDKTNAFQRWLDAKVEELIKNEFDISNSHFLNKFYYKN